MKNENELQTFIAENPWLLNLNYEALTGLPNRGLQFSAGNVQGIDLFFKDKVNKQPVIVEFKHGDFIRENVGQVLECRARIVSCFTRENILLYEVFGYFILAPKLVLVVRKCDDFFRVACNLSGIDVYEYLNFSSVFSDPTKVKAVRDFTETFSKDVLPLTMQRGERINDMIYRPIEDVLRKYQLEDTLQEPRESSAYFYPEYSRLFINRWLFKDNIISIGLYEEIFSENKVCLCFYTKDGAAFRKFCELYQSQSALSTTAEWIDAWSEGYLKVFFDTNQFVQSAGVLFETELIRYLEIVKVLEGTRS
jgi:hypothetical protein